MLTRQHMTQGGALHDGMGMERTSQTHGSYCYADEAISDCLGLLVTVPARHSYPGGHPDRSHLATANANATRLTRLSLLLPALGDPLPTDARLSLAGIDRLTIARATNIRDLWCDVGWSSGAAPHLVGWRKTRPGQSCWPGRQQRLS